MRLKKLCLALMLNTLVLGVAHAQHGCTGGSIIGFVPGDMGDGGIIINYPCGTTEAIQSESPLSSSITILPNANRAFIGSAVTIGKLRFPELLTVSVPRRTVNKNIEPFVLKGGGMRSLAWSALAPNRVNLIVSTRQRPKQGLPAGYAIINTLERKLVGFAPTSVSDAEPSGIAITPDMTAAYVTQMQPGLLAKISLGGDFTPAPIQNLDAPYSPVITPDGMNLLLADFDAVNGNLYVHVLDTATDAIIKTIAISGTPGDQFTQALAISSDGQFAYIGSNYIKKWIITQISLSGLNITNTYLVNDPATTGALRLGVSPDAQSVLAVVQEGGSIFHQMSIVDGSEISATDLGRKIRSFTLIPDQAPTALFTSTPSLEDSHTISFDASSSFSPIGAVAFYLWVFGDGTQLITTDPIVSHTYPQAGMYEASLTVINSQGTSTKKLFTGQNVSNTGAKRAQMSGSIIIRS